MRSVDQILQDVCTATRSLAEHCDTATEFLDAKQKETHPFWLQYLHDTFDGATPEISEPTDPSLLSPSEHEAANYRSRYLVAARLTPQLYGDLYRLAELLKELSVVRDGILAKLLAELEAAEG